MHTYGAFDAKTHLSQILDEVERGSAVVITRHGREIAIIKPYGEIEDSQDRVANAIQAIRTLRKKVTLGENLSIKDLIEEGRR